MSAHPLTAAIVRLAVPLAGGVYEFVRTSVIVADAGPEHETQGRYRAHWVERIYQGTRYVEVTSVEFDVGKTAPLWKPDTISMSETAAIEAAIEMELRGERVTRPWTDADEYDSRRKA